MTNIDLFAFVNLALFAFMGKFVYYQRFVMYRGVTNIYEFFIYASIIFIFIIYVWKHFRNVSVPLSILFLIEMGILIHFAGAFVIYDGHRLYDHIFLLIRYDKYVHFVNAAITTVVVLYIFVRQKYQLDGFLLFVSMLMVMGLGAFHEIVEFMVVLTLKNTGVGRYINNLSDMVANFLGTFTVTVFVYYTFYSKKKLK